jgi:hypothetical protein
MNRPTSVTVVAWLIIAMALEALVVFGVNALMGSLASSAAISAPAFAVVEVGVTLLVICLAIWLVRGARRKRSGAFALGAVLMLFGLGNVREPDNLPILEAKRVKPKKGNESGDPPPANSAP